MVNQALYFLCLPLLLVGTPSSPPDSSYGKAHISQIHGKGRVIRLSDGTEYEVDPEYRQISITWLALDNNRSQILIQDTEDGSSYPIVLTHTGTKETIRVKRL